MKCSTRPANGSDIRRCRSRRDKGRKCEFDVELNLGPGTYYLGVYLYRYDVEREYDHVFPATSFVVTTDRDTRGAANLYPAVARFESAAPLALVRAVGN